LTAGGDNFFSKRMEGF